MYTGVKCNDFMYTKCCVMIVYTQRRIVAIVCSHCTVNDNLIYTTRYSVILYTFVVTVTTAMISIKRKYNVAAEYIYTCPETS